MGFVEFEESLVGLLREVCTTCAKWEVPGRFWYKVRVKGPGSLEYLPSLRPDFEALSSPLLALLEQTDSTHALFGCVKAVPRLSEVLLVDAAGNPIADPAFAFKWFTARFVVPLVIAYTRRAGFVFDEVVARSLCSALEGELNSPDREVLVLAPLANLALTVDEICIEDGLRIRAVSPEEMERWINWESLFGGPPLDLFVFSEINSLVEYRFREPRFGPFGGGYDAELVDRLVGLLRLITDRSVYSPFFEQSTVTVLGSNRSLGWKPLTYLPDQRGVVDERVGKQFVALWHKISKSQVPPELQVALRRWNSSFERATEEDRLIDYWIAFESLFLDSSEDELSFRVSLRIAAFLGGTGEERLEIYEAMRESYGARSKIVHGKRAVRNLPQVAATTRRYLRAAILKCLHLTDPRPAITGIERRLLAVDAEGLVECEGATAEGTAEAGA